MVLPFPAMLVGELDEKRSVKLETTSCIVSCRLIQVSEDFYKFTNMYNLLPNGRPQPDVYQNGISETECS